ncbi:NADH-quinone oxidoreductase subunit C [Candidatus Woesearchaeota archaeon]|nr:NADH-quinone oxidoreductase subunit C [Candidatus Woesearchaeota archaeon]
MKIQDQELHVSVPDEQFMAVVEALSHDGFELSSLFAVEGFGHTKGFTLFYVLEKKKHQPWLILERSITGTTTSSIAKFFPSACWYEREMMDGFGMSFEDALDTRRLFLMEQYPEGFHPLLRSFKNTKITSRKHILPQQEYTFKQVNGEGVYHIPVGPVHAGIIEPGHFRFSVIGETICNLEIRMFYKHRGVEKLAEGKKPSEVIPLAESISGDETTANAVAFCTAVEKISGIVIPKSAAYLRILFLELERMYSLLGDLAGMIIDVAYPLGASPFFILREELLRQNHALTGSRFMKNTIFVGGVRCDLSNGTLTQLKKYLPLFSRRLQEAVNHVVTMPSVVDRFETTGVIRRDLVHSLHLTGPVARASGELLDTRVDHVYGLYHEYVPKIRIEEKGDVLARFTVKVAEVLEAAELCRKVLVKIPSGSTVPEIAQGTIKDGSVLMVVESARGQNIHWVWIHEGKISRYKVRTASFCNWQAIEHAVLDNIVPDFPLINKSLNLSYAGTDL